MMKTKNNIRELGDRRKKQRITQGKIKRELSDRMIKTKNNIREGRNKE